MEFEIKKKKGKWFLIPFVGGIFFTIVLALSNNVHFYSIYDGNYDDNFILVFYQPGCVHCLKELPVVRELSKKYRIKAVDVSENREFALKYGVSATPTIVLHYGGKRKFLVGEHSYGEIVQEIEKMLANGQEGRMEKEKEK